MKKEYYYNYDVLCDMYCMGGVIHRDEEMYAYSEEDLYKRVRDNFESDYVYNLEEVEEYGPIEVKINYTDDPKFKGTDKYMYEEEED